MRVKRFLLDPGASRPISIREPCTVDLPAVHVAGRAPSSSILEFIDLFKKRSRGRGKSHPFRDNDDGFNLEGLVAKL